MAIPTWLGQPSSVSKVALERMEAFLSETRDDGETPIAYKRVAGVVVVGNEDGAHHVIGETNAELNDISYSMPGQNWTYWNKGPGPGEEEWLTTEERDWSITTGRACASNLLGLARRRPRPSRRRRRADPRAAPDKADLPSAAGGDRRVLCGLVHWHEGQCPRPPRGRTRVVPGRALE
jgi:hypothetical protein